MNPYPTVPSCLPLFSSVKEFGFSDVTAIQPIVGNSNQISPNVTEGVPAGWGTRDASTLRSTPQSASETATQKTEHSGPSPNIPKHPGAYGNFFPTGPPT